MSQHEERRELNSLVREIDEDNALVYLYSCNKQGQWLKWDCVMSLDCAWKEQLYLWNPELLAFRVNAMHDVLPSPANLHLWKKTDSPLCPLCNAAKGTLHHILNHCSISLNQGRFTWRRD